MSLVLGLFLGAALSTAFAALPEQYIDTTFGEAGTITIAGPSARAGAIAGPVLRMADGSLVVVSQEFNTYAYALRKFDRTGEVDPTFGEQGVVRPEPVRPETTIYGVFGDDAGRIVIWGILADNRTYLRRFTPDGKPDATFGDAGFINLSALPVTPQRGGFDRVLGYHPIAGGAALVVVTRADYSGFGFPTDSNVFVVRLQPTGTVDTSYGLNDLAQISRFAIGSRLLADGTLEVWDESSTARVSADGRSAQVIGPALLPRDAFRQADGSSIVKVASADSPTFEVRKADGTPDAYFGNAGRPVDTDPTLPYLIYAFRTPDGGVVAAGRLTSAGTIRLCVWRANGRIESCGTYDGWPSQIPTEFPAALMAPGGLLYVAMLTAGGFDVQIVRLNVAAPNVEYFNSVLGHYFITYDGDEARRIDEGVAGPGWSRTGRGFKTGGTTPVCRFYGTPGIGSNSHFFTIDRDECELVKKDPGWTFEGYDFYATPAVGGQCQAPLIPVYRFYNQRAVQRDSNHRHVTDLSVRPAMEAAGWAYEGVAMCVRP